MAGYGFDFDQSNTLHCLVSCCTVQELMDGRLCHGFYLDQSNTLHCLVSCCTAQELMDGRLWVRLRPEQYASLLGKSLYRTGIIKGKSWKSKSQYQRIL